MASQSVDLGSSDAASIAANTAAIAANTASITALSTRLDNRDQKDSVRAASLTNLTLSGAQTVDGVTLVNGDRIGALGQTSAATSGIYVYNSAGAWSRATDADVSAEVTSGMWFFVEEGTLNAGKAFELTTANPIVLGTTALTFQQFAALFSNSTPGSDSAAGAVGTASTAARSDHTHPAVRRLWTWANAAARVAQSVTSGQIGLVGYQTDMDLEYVLLGVSPTRWGRLEDPSMATIGTVLCNAAGNMYSQSNLFNVQTGALGARTLASTNKATARPRSTYNTGSVAGNTAYARGTGGQQVISTGNGMRYRICCGPGAVSADMRWVYGLFDILGSNVNQSPTVVTNALAVGADGGTLQIYTNDGAGAATATPVSTFPGVTAGEMYDVEFYSPDGTDVRWQVLRISTGDEVSGTISTNIPAASTFMNQGWFACNNATAAVVSVDIASLIIQQRVH